MVSGDLWMHHNWVFTESMLFAVDVLAA